MRYRDHGFPFGETLRTSSLSEALVSDWIEDRPIHYSGHSNILKYKGFLNYEHFSEANFRYSEPKITILVRNFNGLWGI